MKIQKHANKKLHLTCQALTPGGKKCRNQAIPGTYVCKKHFYSFYHLKKLFQIGSNFYRKLFCRGRARPLEYGELHLGCHNYTGPGTEDIKYQDYPPYNNIDNCSKTHDRQYRLAIEHGDKRTVRKLIRQADRDAIQCYDQYPKENGYKAAKLGIQKKQALEQKTGIQIYPFQLF